MLGAPPSVCKTLMVANRNEFDDRRAFGNARNGCQTARPRCLAEAGYRYMPVGPWAR
jgi:hypothetical protein